MPIANIEIEEFESETLSHRDIINKADANNYGFVRTMHYNKLAGQITKLSEQLKQLEEKLNEVIDDINAA